MKKAKKPICMSFLLLFGLLSVLFVSGEATPSVSEIVCVPGSNLTMVYVENPPGVSLASYFEANNEPNQLMTCRSQTSSVPVYWTPNGTIYTRDGSPVDVLVASREWTSSEISDMNNYISQNFSGISTIASPSTMYNCHSYAWYNSSTTNTDWINDASAFVEDSHTTQVSFENIAAGDLVLYYNSGDIVHSAKVVSVDASGLSLVSKWGPLGLYGHTLTNVPNEYYSSDGVLSVIAYRYNNHNYGAYRYTNRIHFKTCSYCGDSIVENHVFVPYGMNYRCRVCGYIDSASHYDTIQEGE